MKRILSVLLVVCMCCGLLVGCGGSDEKEEFESQEKVNVSVDGVYDLSLPNEWDYLGENTMGYSTYCGYKLENDDGYLFIDYVYVPDIEDETTVLDDSMQGLRNTFDDLEELDKTEVDIDSQNRDLYTFSGKYDSKDSELTGKIKFIAAEYGKGYFTLILFWHDESSVEYNQVFTEIIESVSLDMTKEIKEDEEDEENEESEELTGNILLDTESEIEDVLSGTGEFIGNRILYSISKNDMQSVTAEQFVEFMDNRVLNISNAIFNYITIDFGDGTGLLFMPGTAVATYGEIDETDSIVKQIGVIMPDENGTYVYSETE